MASVSAALAGCFSHQLETARLPIEIHGDRPPTGGVDSCVKLARGLPSAEAGCGSPNPISSKKAALVPASRSLAVTSSVISVIVSPRNMQYCNISFYLPLEFLHRFHLRWPQGYKESDAAQKPSDPWHNNQGPRELTMDGTEHDGDTRETQRKQSRKPGNDASRRTHTEASCDRTRFFLG